MHQLQEVMQIGFDYAVFSLGTWLPATHWLAYNSLPCLVNPICYLFLPYTSGDEHLKCRHLTCCSHVLFEKDYRLFSLPGKCNSISYSSCTGHTEKNYAPSDPNLPFHEVVTKSGPATKKQAAVQSCHHSYDQLRSVCHNRSAWREGQLTLPISSAKFSWLCSCAWTNTRMPISLRKTEKVRDVTFNNEHEALQWSGY